MNILHIINYFFLAGTIFYLLSVILAVWQKNTPAKYIFYTGLVCNAISLGLRYRICFPMLPLYQGAFFLPFIIGIIGTIGCRHDIFSVNILPGFFLVTITALAALFFPNDFYIPFLQFKTMFAHGFFLFGVIGKSLFLLAGAGAVQVLLKKKSKDQIKPVARIVSWGFVFYTLSIFSGAAWSWFGWGSPVVWDDPLMATTMATWLLYSFLLHLHLTRFSNPGSRAWFFLAGACFVFCFNCVTEFGPFRLFGGLL